MLSRFLRGGALVVGCLALAGHFHASWAWTSTAASYQNARSASDIAGSSVSAASYSQPFSVGEVSLAAHTATSYQTRSGLESIYEYPGAVGNFTATATGVAGQINISFIAPGNDAGQAPAYTNSKARDFVIKYTTDPAISPASSFAAFLAVSTTVASPPTPLVSGTTQTFRVTGLQDNVTYYFAIEAQESDGLYGALSSGATSLTLVTGCVVIENVCKAGTCDQTTIQAGVAALPRTPGGLACVVIKDLGTYNEQVAVQGFNLAGTSMTIMTDASLGGYATVAPSAAGAAVLQLANTNVNLNRLNIRPAAAFSYGVAASSQSIVISSVNILDPTAFIARAGIYLSSADTVSNSSVAVQTADALDIEGQSNTVSFSTFATSNPLTVSRTVNPAVLIDGSSNNLSQSYVVNQAAGDALDVENGAHNSISLSTIAAANVLPGGGVLFAAASVGFYNTDSDNLTSVVIPSWYGVYASTLTNSAISQSVIGGGLILDVGSKNNTVSLSTIAVTASLGLGPVNAVTVKEASNTVTQSYLASADGAAVSIVGGSNTFTLDAVVSSSQDAVDIASSFNTISQSTITLVADDGTGYDAIAIKGGSSNQITANKVAALMGNGLKLLNSNNNNTISQNAITVGDNDPSGDFAVSLNASSLNNITLNSLTAPGRISAFILQAGSNGNVINNLNVTCNHSAGICTSLYLDNSNSNTITQSTFTSTGVNPGGLIAGLANGASLNAFTADVFSNPSTSGGGALQFNSGASTNTVTASYILENVSNNANDYALYIGGGGLANGPYNNLILNSVISNLGGSGVNFGAPGLFANGPASFNSSVVNSNITAGGGYGVQFFGAQGGSVYGSTIQGSTAAYVNGSTNTSLGGDVLISGSQGSGVWVGSGSKNLSVSSDVFKDAGTGTLGGLYLDKGNFGSINVATDAISGAHYGIYVAAQGPAGVQIVVTSVTVVPLISANTASYGVYLNGLVTGATFYNDGIYWRGPPMGIGSQSAYGLYANNVSGLNFDHNRINEPGMITGAAGGSFIVGAYFNGVQNSEFKFNDVDISGSNLNNVYLVQAVQSTVSIRDDVFASTVTATASSALLYADAQSNLKEDYNDWYSGSGAPSFIVGSGSTNTLAGLFALSGYDAHSISANPLWASTVASGEDFHPLSQAGRCSDPTGIGFVSGSCPLFISTDTQTSLTIDAGDPAESFNLEPLPNGAQVNLGSYGDTVEASKSFGHACLIAKSVSQSGPADATTIAGGLNALLLATPGIINYSACLKILDARVYNEVVTIQGFSITPPGSLLIEGAAAGGGAPTISTGTAGGTPAVVQVLNSYVSLQNLIIQPAQRTNYGIAASSPSVTVSSVSIFDPNNFIAQAGLLLGAQASNSSVVASSISVLSATGLEMMGANESVTGSTIADVSPNGYALYVSGASTATATQDLIVNSTGGAVFIGGGATAELISQSVITGGGLAAALDLDAQTGGTVSQSLISNSSGPAVYLSSAASGGAITQSTITSSGLGAVALVLGGNAAGSGASGNSFTADYVFSSSGDAVYATYAHNNVLTSDILVSSAASLAGFGLHLSSGAANNAVSASFILNPNQTALLFDAGSSGNSVTGSTVTGSASAYGAEFNGAGANSLSTSFVQGSTAVYITGSTNVSVTGSILAAGGSGSGLWLAGGSSGLSFLSNAVLGAGSFAGVDLENDSGAILLASNTISGAQYGIRILAQQAGASVVVTSETVVPELAGGLTSYGLYLNGLTTGATIYNNGVYYRGAAVNLGSGASYGVYAQNVSGVTIRNNRLNEPGLITGGTFEGAYFSGAQATSFKFNDVDAVGVGLANAYLLQAAGSALLVKDNIFLSSFSVTGSSASLIADSGSSLSEDYNDWFSSNAALAFVQGSASASTLAGWQAKSGQDAHSISVNPLWFNPSAGTEDFHPLSQTGRCVDPGGLGFCVSYASDTATSFTVDAGDPSEPLALINLEPTPNGGLPNQGSYGETAEASLSILRITNPPMAPLGVALSTTSATATISWLPVTSFYNGVTFATGPVTPQELSGYLIEAATAPTNAPWTSLTGNVPWSATASSYTTTVTGEYYRVIAVNNSGGAQTVQSEPSEELGPTGDYWIVAYDGRSTLDIPQKCTGALSNYYIVTSSNAADLDGANKGTVFKSIYLKPLFKGLTYDQKLGICGLGTLSLYYSTTPAGGLGVSGLSQGPVSPKNANVFWFNGQRWIPFFANNDTTNQVLTVQTTYLGHFEVQAGLEPTQFTFDPSMISNREITPNGDGLNDTSEFIFANPLHSSISGKLFDMRGAHIADMTADCPDFPSFQCLRWNAKSNGHVVPGGVYVYQLQGESKTYNGTVIVIK